MDMLPSACRLDDLTIANLIDAKTLNSKWPVEFDQKKNIKAARMPLGFAAKMWVSEVDTDRHGRVAAADQQGYYYRWYHGIHILCGEEGLDRYRH